MLIQIVGVILMRDGGRVKLCALEDIAENGLMPKEKLVVKCEPFFAYRTASTIRRYVVDGADQQFDFVIRVFGVVIPPIGVKYVVMPDGSQYRANFNPIFDDDACDCMLTRLEDYYDVITNQTEGTVQPVPDNNGGEGVTL